MSLVAAPRIPFSVVVAAIAVAGVAIYVWRKGGLEQAATAAGAAVVNAAGAVASGAVGAVGAAVGLPTPADTTTDPRVARWLIDQVGYWEASQWAGLPALVAGAQLAKGTGTAPPKGSAVDLAYPNVASYDETARLASRYPAPAKTDSYTGTTFDPMTWGIPQ